MIVMNHHYHPHYWRRRESLIPGIVTIAVLKIISKGPAHGYAIREEVKKILDREIPRSLVYVLLRRLEKRGYVYSEWEVSGKGPARRIYYITEEGKKLLEHKLGCLKKFIGMLKRIIEY